MHLLIELSGKLKMNHLYTLFCEFGGHVRLSDLSAQVDVKDPMELFGAGWPADSISFDLLAV